MRLVRFLIYALAVLIGPVLCELCQSVPPSAAYLCQTVPCSISARATRGQIEKAALASSTRPWRHVEFE
jgi:hypothetical protein